MRWPGFFMPAPTDQWDRMKRRSNKRSWNSLDAKAVAGRFRFPRRMAFRPVLTAYLRGLDLRCQEHSVRVTQAPRTSQRKQEM
jgi:hypothetical protein